MLRGRVEGMKKEPHDLRRRGSNLRRAKYREETLEMERHCGGRMEVQRDEMRKEGLIVNARLVWKSCSKCTVGNEQPGKVCVSVRSLDSATCFLSSFLFFFLRLQRLKKNRKAPIFSPTLSIPDWLLSGLLPPANNQDQQICGTYVISSQFLVPL